MKHTFKIIGALLILSLCVAPAAAADAWPAAMADWDHRAPIEYAGCDQDVYQQDVVIHRSEGTSYEETVGDLKIWHVYVGDRCKSDYGDVRFTDASGNALPYYLWPDYDSSSARICVRLEGADAAGELQVWYGNPAAATTSDGDATYILFDHFDQLDSSKWAVDTGSWVISNGHLKQSTAGATEAVLRATGYTIAPTSLSHTIDMRVKWDGGSTVTGAIDPSLGTESLSDYCMMPLRYLGGSKITEIRREDSVASTKPLSWSGDSWHTLRVDLHGALVDGYVDGVKLHSGVTHGLTSPLNYFFIHTWDAQPLIDFYLVRAYSATPPAATAFGPEQEAVAPPPTAQFSATPTRGTAPLTVTFTDTSAGGPTSWLWNFGDGNTSSAQNPTHSYSSTGTYTVSLTATNEAGSDGEIKTDYITIGNAPVAAFSGNPTSGSSPLSVTFTDSSTHTPTSWDWDFGDSSEHSTSQNPSHSYSSNGAYTVTLTATNAYGSDTETKTNYIAVADLTAAFSVDDTTSTPGTSLIFTDGSYGGGTITAWSWNFGDTGTSTLQNPTHSYSTPGTYTVTLTVTDSNTDTDTETKTDYITIGNAPTAAFSGTPLSGASPLTVSFTDSSTAPTSWSWNFGDGGTSSLQNPSHEYAQDGAYTVTLTVTNPYGSDTETKTDYISLGSMTTAAFSSLSEGSLNQTIRFTDESLNSPTSWDWDFGDGSTHAIIQNPTHSYDSTGTYTVTLTASNAISSDTISHTITIVLFAHRPTAAATVAPLDDTAYNEIMDSLNLGESYVNADESGIDYRIIISSAVGYIVGPLGAFGYLIIFFAAFGGMWIVQKDTLIPGLIGMVYGAILYKMLPGEFQMITIVVLALSATGVVWSLYIRKDT